MVIQSGIERGHLGHNEFLSCIAKIATSVATLQMTIGGHFDWKIASWLVGLCISLLVVGF